MTHKDDPLTSFPSSRTSSSHRWVWCLHYIFNNLKSTNLLYNLLNSKTSWLQPHKQVSNRDSLHAHQKQSEEHSSVLNGNLSVSLCNLEKMTFQLMGEIKIKILYLKDIFLEFRQLKLPSMIYLTNFDQQTQDDTWFRRLRQINGDPPSIRGVKSKTLTPQLLWSNILKYSVPNPVKGRKVSNYILAKARNSNFFDRYPQNVTA